MTVHVYEDPPRFATAFDPLTGTQPGHCIPGCIRADDPTTGRALLRVPVYMHNRAGCRTVYDLYRLLDYELNGTG